MKEPAIDRVIRHLANAAEIAAKGRLPIEVRHYIAMALFYAAKEKDKKMAKRRVK